MRPILALAAFVFITSASAQTTDPGAEIRSALRAELDDFSRSDWDRKPDGWTADKATLFSPAAGPALTRYRQQLVKIGAWKSPAVWHQAGVLPLVRAGKPTVELGVNVFFPEGTPKGTLLFVHGYMSHAANFAYTFAYFLSRGWAVTTVDLPGHGLSGGPRADVADFSDYGDAVRAWVDWEAAQKWPGPRILMAHSLGTASCLEMLRRPGAPTFDQIVFCAPLLRTQWFSVLAAANAIVGGWVTVLPSTFGWDGYLDGYQMPVHWFKALDQWLVRLQKQGPLKLPLRIYSGDADTVVDPVWNQKEYARLVPAAPWTNFPGQGHMFLAARQFRGGFHEQLARDLGL